MAGLTTNEGSQAMTDSVRSRTVGVVNTIRLIAGALRSKPQNAPTVEGRSRERYRRALLTTVASFSSRALNLLTSLVSIPLTFKYLGAERYGLWMVLTSLIAVMGFADLGIGNGLLNAVAEADGRNDRELTREYVSSAFLLLSIIAALLGVLGILAYPFIPWSRVFNVSSLGIAEEGAKGFAVLYALFVINIPLGVVTRIQTGLQRGYSSQIFSALGSLMSLACILIAINFRSGLSMLVFASSIGPVIAILLNAIFLFKAQPWLLPTIGLARISSASKIFKLGMLFFVMQVAIAVGFSSDNLVIAQVLGAGAVAAYAIPQKLFAYTTMVFMFGLTPLWPAYGEAISRGDNDWAKRTLRRSVYLTLVFSVIFNTVLVIIGPLLLRHWVGDSFRVSPLLLVLMGIWGVVGVVSSALSMFFNGVGGKLLRFQTGMLVLMAVMNIVLSILITRRIGVAGVVAGSIISQSICLVPLVIVLRRYMRRNFQGSNKSTNIGGAYFLLTKKDPPS